MNDWLSDLREAKKRVIDESETGIDSHQVSFGLSEELLRTSQQHIDDLLQATQVESQLNQFMEEIIRGHPWFPESSLSRIVASQKIDSPEIREPLPWSGPIKGNFLPHPLNLANGRFVTRVEWNLGLSYCAPQSSRSQTIEIPIVFSAKGCQIGGEKLAEETLAGLQTAIKNSFEHEIKVAQTHRYSTHRRHRRWYRRLWVRIRKERLPLVIILVIVLGLLAIVVGLMSARSSDFLRPRRMVQAPSAISSLAFSLERDFRI